MDGEEAKRALRELFEAQVMNHGDYSLVYGQSSGPGPALMLGYRRTPLELLLCPVHLGHPTRASGGRSRAMAGPAGQVTSIDLTNVAIVADTGTGYQVESVTGFHAFFEVDRTPRLPAEAVATGSRGGMVALEQGRDAEEFHEFMGHFMDVLDAFYDQVPDVTEIFHGRYAPPRVA